MCTAVTLRTRDLYFGRTLDLERSYSQQITFTPRNFPLPFRRGGTLTRHHSILGMAAVRDGYPLYFDAFNEKGLAMAGLNFPACARYFPPAPEKDNISPFELIPWVLGRCGDLPQARALLARLNLTQIPFSPQLPLSPLHWIVADSTGALTAESTREGLFIHENPVGVLTNAPPFPAQLSHLSGYLHLSPDPPENRLAPELDLSPCSRGMGAVGLPGDLSSPSRFVRAVFTKFNSLSSDGEEESVARVFHILSAVSQPRGCCRLGDGQVQYTRYTSCCSTGRGIYYYTTYENPSFTAVDLRREAPEGRVLRTFPLRQESCVRFEN